ncbi:LCP family protein required for cell wall assembly [Saccharomonospora amisosensis]|uniref:LCP family protein required for cell wall assembly n=1 Tax=Saccharomonospora amisosensis TaxID=1128677 RepID=A0A7X5UTU4_9PSEU|nr:LCP family protein [Saccharomonospora amisosensis]NIJ14010.1 LCP family protein required for cell wall assembly [Saccharomonospora amisosensis]
MTDWARGPVEARPVRRGSRAGVFALLSAKVVLSLLSVTVLALTWYGWQFIGAMNSGVTTTDVFDSEPEAVPLDGAVDILLVGQDSRTDAKGNPLPREVLDKLHAGDANGERQTDTMILVHIPQDGTRAVAISFPRDSWVELAGGYGSSKLNSAFVYAFNDTFQTLQQQGETDLAEIEEKAKVAGRKNLIATIEQLIGKPGMIDRYAEVNLASFYEVTKALGGIEVCLKEPVREPKSGVNLPQGRQTIKGVQALAFVRQRYGLENGDLDRIARQQAFLSGLVRKVLSTDVLMNPSRLSDVVEAVQKSVVLSKDWDLLEFAAQMRNLSGGNVEFHTIPVVGNAWIGGAAVLEVDAPQVQEFVDDLVTEPGADSSDTPQTVPGAEQYTVDVYNASGDPQAGQDVRQLLREQGFEGEQYATTDPMPSTVVYYAPGDEAGVRAIRKTLGEDVSAEPATDLSAGVLRLVVGTDFELDSPSEAAREGYLGQPRAYPPRASSPAQQDDRPDAPITAGDVPCVN